MEDNSDQFPEQDYLSIVNKIKKGASAFNNMQDYAINLIRRLDKKG